MMVHLTVKIARVRVARRASEIWVKPEEKRLSGLNITIHEAASGSSQVENFQQP